MSGKINSCNYTTDQPQPLDFSIFLLPSQMAVRKKLIFVCNTSWSAYKFRLPLLRLLAGRGYKIYVLAPEDRHSELIRKENGAVFIPLRHFKATRFSPLADLRLYRELCRHYRQIGPDLIFHYTIKANIYGTLAAAKGARASISVITGLGYTFLNNRLMREAASALYRYALKKASEVWFLNKDDQAYFIEKKIMPAHKTFVLPGEGIDTGIFREQKRTEDKFRDDQQTETTGVRPQAEAQDTPGEKASSSFGAAPNTGGKQTVNFLLIARIIKEKGIEEYVRAAEWLKQKGYAITCRLIGFYDKQSPSSIPVKKFSGWVNSGAIVYLGAADDILPFIEQADCIVLPSYREGLPLSLLEGASMGKPLIASDTAGCREIVEHDRNGYLFPVRDAGRLAAAMEKFYHLPQADRIAMGAAARKTVTERFSMEIVHALYLSRIAKYIQDPPAEETVPIVNQIPG